MSETLDDVLDEVGKGGAPAPVYLLWGEEFLVRKGADDLVKALLPDASVGLNLMVMDGASPREVAQELATMPLFPGKKVVLVRDPEFLAPKKGRGDALGKARDAWKAGRRKEGARRVLALAARAGWGVKELDPSAKGAPSADDWREELDVELGEVELQFLKEVAAFCKEEGITAPESDATVLVDVLAEKLPDGHTLVMAATDVDAKSPLLKVAKDKGRLVERKLAAKLKELDLSELVADVLRPHKKKLGPGAEAALKDRIGKNMRLLQSELEKLALYAQGPAITVQDIELLVHREREEEFLELSDALQKRDLEATLRYMEDALANDGHPLQILGAVAAIVRQLLDGQDRIARFVGGPFTLNYNAFQARVWPRIEEEVKARRGKVPNPYAAFKGMEAAARFKKAELLQTLALCAETDLALKSGGGRLALERLLWAVCGKAA